MVCAGCVHCRVLHLTGNQLRVCIVQYHGRSTSFVSHSRLHDIRRSLQAVQPVGSRDKYVTVAEDELRDVNAVSAQLCSWWYAHVSYSSHYGWLLSLAWLWYWGLRTKSHHEQLCVYCNSLVHGLHTRTAVPRMTWPSTLHVTVKWESARLKKSDLVLG